MYDLNRSAPEPNYFDYKKKVGILRIKLLQERCISYFPILFNVFAFNFIQL